MLLNEKRGDKYIPAFSRTHPLALSLYTIVTLTFREGGFGPEELFFHLPLYGGERETERVSRGYVWVFSPR